MFSNIGIPGVIMLILVCLIVFGSKNLPEVGRSVGKSLREFKGAFGDNEENKNSDVNKKDPISIVGKERKD
ncbi:twin-arginine translocase TatA/TatE family subunit [Sutcliffiella sp. NPDC057660]|uniref:twin-arginine translocase TatA/TatE family subunit n=1 Tax=Sutcliffiella sp. NPDC057660 TaxID=3346199 RepID=UPI0036C62833